MGKWIKSKFQKLTLDCFAWLDMICLTKLIWEQMAIVVHTEMVIIR